MEKPCCEFRKEDGIECQVRETDDGYRIEVKGDKQKLRQWQQSCCGTAAKGASSCC